MNTEKQTSLPNGLRITIAIGTLISVLIAFNQCTVDKKTNKSPAARGVASAPATATGDAGDIANDSELPDGLVMPPMNKPTADSDADEIDVGVKSFEQIYLSMAAVTGVSPSEAAVLKLYKEIIVQLPADNNVKNFDSANQVAITKLAAEFCEKLVETQALRVVIWPTIDFTKTPTQVLSQANKQLIITQAIAKFMPPMDSETQATTSAELVKLFDELLTGENLSSSTTTKKVVKGMCISTLASAHATLL